MTRPSHLLAGESFAKYHDERASCGGVGFEFHARAAAFCRDACAYLSEVEAERDALQVRVLQVEALLAATAAALKEEREWYDAVTHTLGVVAERAERAERAEAVAQEQTASWSREYELQRQRTVEALEQRDLAERRAERAEAERYWLRAALERLAKSSPLYHRAADLPADDPIRYAVEALADLRGADLSCATRLPSDPPIPGYVLLGGKLVRVP